MLDLGVPTRSVAGVDLAADSEDALVFHVLPPVPKIAFRNGAPDVQLLRFVSDGKLTGGHFRLSVRLSHPPSVLEQVRASLAEELRKDTITLTPVAVTRRFGGSTLCRTRDHRKRWAHFHFEARLRARLRAARSTAHCELRCHADA